MVRESPKTLSQALGMATVGSLFTSRYIRRAGGGRNELLRWVVAGILWLLFGVVLLWRPSWTAHGEARTKASRRPLCLMARSLLKRSLLLNFDCTKEMVRSPASFGKRVRKRILLSQERKEICNRACFDILLDSEDMRWCVQVRRNQLIGAWSKGPEGGPLLGGAGPGSASSKLAVHGRIDSCSLMRISVSMRVRMPCLILPTISMAGGASSGSVSNPSDPGSWNRYSYTRGDPVNRFDPAGTCDEDTATSVNVCATSDDVDSGCRNRTTTGSAGCPGDYGPGH